MFEVDDTLAAHPPAARFIYAMLYYSEDPMDYDDLERATGLTKRTIIDMVRLLEDDGYIESDAHENGGRRKTHTALDGEVVA